MGCTTLPMIDEACDSGSRDYPPEGSNFPLHDAVVVEQMRRAENLQRQGRAGEALGILRRLAQGLGASLEGCVNYGAALLQAGEVDLAAQVFETAVQRWPESTAAWSNLGVARQRQGRNRAAQRAFREVCVRDPASWTGPYNLAALASSEGDFETAEAAYLRAVRARPDDPRSHAGLGATRLRLGKLEQAIQACDEAVRLDPQALGPHHNRAVCLQRLGREDEAIRGFREAIRRHPGSWRSHNNLGLLLLKRGRFEEGWREFEWRFQNRGEPATRAGRPQPIWRGERLEGKTLLVCCEQGFGDMTQFVRLTSHLAELGGRVVVESPPNLMRLFATCPGVDAVLDWRDPWDGADLQIPLVSVPRLLGLGIGELCGPVPYLIPGPLRSSMKDRLGPRNGRLRVGIVWAGDPKNPLDAARSCTLEKFVSLAELPGVCLHSLQFQDAGVDENRLEELGIVPLGRHLGPFDETAAVFREMDLVITVDTVTAHLAGAIGQRVWTLLPFPCDWRWRAEGDTTPWYPSMRLFRQRFAGDWRGVFEQVASVLLEEV